MSAPFLDALITSAVTPEGEAKVKIREALSVPVALLCADGGFLCKECALSGPSAPLVAEATVDPDGDPQWRIIGCQAPALYHGDICDHCGKSTILPRPMAR